MAVRVVTDSACDLPQHLVDELNIGIVPLTIRIGSDEFVDRRDLTPAEFWARCAKSPALPETAAPSAGAFEEVFRAAAADGCEGVVSINLSGGLSATLQAAQIAATAVADVIPVRTVDSRSVSIALGLMVLGAARRAQAGKSVEDIAGAAEDEASRTKLFATLDTLDNLKKGGRIGGAQAFFGTMLSIKPIIELRDGVVEAESRQRTRSKSLRYLVDKVKEHGRVENLAVIQAECPDLEEFLDLLSALYPRDEIVVGDVGAVIGAHSGIRAMGVSFQVPAPAGA
jgi:fatty acid kinase fatty acid binding subunit